MNQASQSYPALTIGGQNFIDTSSLLAQLGVTRQTLWNWRRTNKIPAGSRYRNRIVFTLAEVEVIEAFAHQIEPAELRPPSNQLKLTLK